MRIAITNWSGRKVGGTETYLGGIVPALLGLGHEVGFWYEVDRPDGRDRIALPDTVARWCVAELGARRAVTELEAWQPDVIYAHGLLDPRLESATLDIAPGVFFAHSYYGTCISGAKTFKQPVVTPCQRLFGWQCLLHYYPHRCGGWSPITMLRDYWRQGQRLELLSRYKAIVTHSRHMETEYLKHGLAADRSHQFPYYLAKHEDFGTPVGASARLSRQPSRLLFLGRMDPLKGGQRLLEALPQVAASLNRPLQVTFAGDGPQRSVWERAAASLQERIPSFRVAFVGWLASEARDAALSQADVLVIPSLWPEPFGLVGPEAGLRGVPAVAFAVGGIPDWLEEGINGCLAPGHPPTASGLAEAIVRCLENPIAHARLCRGAFEVAQRFTMGKHVARLQEIFEKILHS